MREIINGGTKKEASVFINTIVLSALENPDRRAPKIKDFVMKGYSFFVHIDARGCRCVFVCVSARKCVP